MESAGVVASLLSFRSDSAAVSAFLAKWAFFNAVSQSLPEAQGTIISGF